MADSWLSLRRCFAVAFAHAIWLPLLGLLFVPGAHAQGGAQGDGAGSGFALVAVQHRPTYGPEVDQVTLQPLAAPPSRVVQKFLEPTGFSETYDTHVNFSKRTHVGCYKADFSITENMFEGANQDPNQCYETCQAKWPNASSYDILVAVHAERCGCVLKDFLEFTVVADNRCTYYCQKYQNEICGGPPDYWGLFVEYDFQALTTHGAFDPWRNLWFTVVVVSDMRLRGGFPTPDEYLPERYFLHAVDVYNGRPSTNS